jgi:hypothetical protein
LYPLNPSTFNWAWTVNKKTSKSGAGLQGSIGDKVELVWYKNQKQLFKARIIPPEAVRINIERTRLNPEIYVKTILAALQAQNS